MDDIKRVPLKERKLESLYISADGSSKIQNQNTQQRNDAKERQRAVARTYNSILEGNKINGMKTDRLNVWSAARTPNSFNVNAQQALNPFMNLKQGDNVSFFDIEAVGTPEHMRKKKDWDLFAITELSFGGTKFNGENFVKSKSNIVSMAVAPGKNEYERLKKQINQLKQNPMMALSQDMHRTLLDLAKYADESKFNTTTEYNGMKYTSLIGHARTPAPNTALTRNTVKEIETGLENLFNKGTKLDDALAVFQGHVTKEKAKLGGYNIHHYDLPAILGTIKDSKVKKFFQEAASTSLDFYHGYSATTKDPYSLTGASMRQEHIHQNLLNRKKNPIVSSKSAPDGQKPTFLYHLAADDIHANIDIAGFTYREINNFIEDAKKSPSDYELSPSTIKTDILKKGDELFSFQSGFYDPSKHKYNLIGKTDKDGKIAPKWENFNTSLPANENFVISEFLQDVALPGADKKGYGVRLDSKDIEGKTVLLMSETQEQLAQQIHGSFMQMDKDNPVASALRTNKIQNDAAFREYEKMFDSNGWNKMKELYGYLDKADESKKGFDWAQHVIKSGGSEELALKFPHMVERLKAEKPVWDEVREQLLQSGINKDQRSVALRHVKNKLDTLGDNKAEVNVEGNKFFNFDFLKGDDALFNAKNTEQIKNAFRSYVHGKRQGERVGNPEKSYKIARIEELGNSIISNFGMGKDDESTKKVNSLVKSMKSEVYAGNKVETALTTLSNLVRDHVESKGKSSFTREITNGVTPARSEAIKKFKDILPETVQEAASNAKGYAKAKDGIASNPKLKNFLQEQDKYIKELFEKNFAANGMNKAQAITDAGNMAAKYESLVGKIMSAYSNDFHTQIRLNENGNPLLVLADKKSGMNLNEIKTYEELVTDPKIATVELPSFDENLKVKYGNNRKASIVRSGIREGKTYHSTSVTDSLNMVLDYASTAKDVAGRGKGNKYIEISQGLRYRVGKQVDPVQTDANRKISLDERNLYSLNNAIGGEIRSSKWDITGFSEEWYRENQGRLGLYTVADKIADQAKQNGTSFFEAMGGRAQGYAMSGGLLDFASRPERPGSLKGSIFGINNRSASKGLIGTGNTDARTYMALGHYYSDSVENPHKTVNYRAVDPNVAEKVLAKAGKNKTYRTQNSFISSQSYDVLNQANEGAGEIRGLTMQTGYMTDEEIALKLRDTQTVSKYKEMIRKAKADGRLTDVEARRMVKSLEMGMLSTREGLAFMDHQLMKAFDGTDEIRVNMKADNVQFNSAIQEAIEKQAAKQGLDNGQWKEKGIVFDKPVQINISDMMDDKEITTLGKYWNNGIESSIKEETRFRKGDKVHILGFNADDPSSKSLILGRERKTGHGFKAVTEGGFRSTMVPMIGEIMSDLYGVDGIDQVISHLGSKKGATDLPALIRGFDTQIRQQFDGTIEKRTKSFGSEDEALGAFYRDVHNMLGIETKNQDGQRTVASDFGLDGEHTLNYEQREKLSQKWQKELGLNREVYADITMAHDVWNRQGGLDRGKVTSKEIDMLQRSYNRTELYAPGQVPAHVKFMKDSVFGHLADDEIKKQQGVFKEVIQAAGNYENGAWKPKKGDVVIDYTSDGMGVVGDVNAQMKDDILHVSKDTFEAIPEKNGRNQVFTVGDYNKTVINAGAMDYKVEGGESKSIQSFLRKSKGAAYLKLPEYQGMPTEYVPLINANSMKLPTDADFEEKTAFLDTLHGHYASIARKTEEFNNLHVTDEMGIEKVQDRKNELGSQIKREYSNLITTLGDSTSKEGMGRVMSRRLEMSSQYQFGGVNPISTYTKEDGRWVNSGKAKEGEIYMNEQDVRRLIGDKSENIAKSWGVDTDSINFDEIGIKQRKKESDATFKKRAMTEYVMQNWNENNTYSTTVRYPSIDVGTTQALKVKVSDAVGKGQVVGLPGMAERISGDFDGDNLAVFLSHYGIDDEERRSAVLTDIANLHEYDKKKNVKMSGVVMDGIEKDFRENLAAASNLEADHRDVVTASKRFFSGDGDLTNDLTLGSLHGEEAQGALRTAIESKGKHDTWGIVKNWSNNALDGNEEAFNLAKEEHDKSLLRVGTAGSIGSTDNTRMKMSNAYQPLAEAKYRLFNNAEGPLRYTKEDFNRETGIVDEFLREYSQKSISAKKTEGGTLTAEEVMGEVYSMLDRVKNPSNGVDLDHVASELSEGLYKDKPFLEIGEGEVYKGSSQKFIKSALELLGEGEQVYKQLGYKGYNDSSLLTGASQGTGFENLSKMVKNGQQVPGSDSVNLVADMAKQVGQERMSDTQEAFDRGVKRIYERKASNISNRLQDNDSTLEIMNSGAPKEPKIIGNSATPLYKTMRDGMDDSLGELATTMKHSFGKSAAGLGIAGAAGFGALWATNTLMKKAPEPEGLQDMAPVNPSVLTTPTARVTPKQNGEYINIAIKAKAAQRLNHNDLAAMINNEVMSMANVNMNTNVMVTDNSQQIDGKWVEGAVANAMNKGYAY